MTTNQEAGGTNAWGGKSGTSWQGGKASDSGLTQRTMATVGVLTSVAVAIIWGGFWLGLALSVLWGWFVVPLFGLPVLTVWQAYGLMLMARMFLPMRLGEKTNDTFGLAMCKAFSAPPFVAGVFLLMGWCVKTWA
ncbi:hypothetical protein [Acidovorax sp. K2F]|uniref:hypothetical protein n=1 Tax=Acidovorax sp. K2F TaxID=2978125 RepID=UPI0021B14219|nr:hypothetical protein [Acidovorax sp. K2F]MCT6721637.1 hypothetical protein [Acidovorax sp. K2F]